MISEKLGAKTEKIAHMCGNKVAKQQKGELVLHNCGLEYSLFFDSINGYVVLFHFPDKGITGYS